MVAWRPFPASSALGRATTESAPGTSPMLARWPFPAPAALGKVTLELALGFSPTLPPPLWTPGRIGCLRVPAWGAQERGQTHLRGGTALGTSVPAALSPQGPDGLWWLQAHRDAGVAPVCLAQGIPRSPSLQPLPPAWLRLCRVVKWHWDICTLCHLVPPWLCIPPTSKLVAPGGLTGRSGLWKPSGIPSDTELSEPLVLQGERTTCSPQWHHGVTWGDRG